MDERFKSLYKTKIQLIQKAVKECKYISIHVSGHSMEPTIQDGENILIEPASKIVKGDILWFADPYGKMALHRVINFSLNGITLLGDNANQTDKIPLQCVLGKAVLNINRKKKIESKICKPNRIFVEKGINYQMKLYIIEGKFAKISIETG